MNEYYVNLIKQVLDIYDNHNQDLNFMVYALSSIFVFAQDCKCLDSILCMKEFKSRSDIFFRAYRLMEGLEKTALANARKKESK